MVTSTVNGYTYTCAVRLGEPHKQSSMTSILTEGSCDDALPVSALTKTQLQQALVHLLKVHLRTCIFVLLQLHVVLYSVLCDFYKTVLLPLLLMLTLVTGVIPLAPLLTTCSFYVQTDSSFLSSIHEAYVRSLHHELRANSERL